MQADLWLTVISWSLVFPITAFALFWFVYRPWQMNWGATDEEGNYPLPGDGIVEHPTFKATRGVSIEARPPIKHYLQALHKPFEIEMMRKHLLEIKRQLEFSAIS